MNLETDLTSLSKESLSALLTNNMKKENSYLLGQLEYSKTHEKNNGRDNGHRSSN